MRFTQPCPTGWTFRPAIPNRIPRPRSCWTPRTAAAYPPDFAAAADYGALRTAEDTWVDDLWSDAVDMGAPLLAATFPRAYIDANRAPDEIDELLLDRPGPAPSTPRPRSAWARA